MTTIVSPEEHVQLCAAIDACITQVSRQTYSWGYWTVVCYSMKNGKCIIAAQGDPNLRALITENGGLSSERTLVSFSRVRNAKCDYLHILSILSGLFEEGEDDIPEGVLSLRRSLKVAFTKSFAKNEIPVYMQRLKGYKQPTEGMLVMNAL